MRISRCGACARNRACHSFASHPVVASRIADIDAASPPGALSALVWVSVLWAGSQGSVRVCACARWLLWKRRSVASTARLRAVLPNSSASRFFGSATYFWPFQSHASLGPSCAVADIRGDGGTVWTSSQGTHGLRANLSKVFALSLDKLRVVFLDGSGSYGTNGGDHVAADAVLLSKTIAQ